MNKNKVLYVLLVVLSVLALTSIAATGGQTFTTNLTGAVEVPGPGDPDGRGNATVTILYGQGQLCYTLRVFNIESATAAHIHAGAAGVAGPVVVALNPPPTNGPSKGCLSVSRDLLKAILENPSGYYINVHNAEYPAGAVRGQLGN